MWRTDVPSSEHPPSSITPARPSLRGQLQARVRSSGEFSAKTKRGRISPMSRAYSFHKPERSPAIPAPLPAALMSWQGNPPQRMSTVPLQGRPSRVQTSSQIGNSGKIPSRCRASSTSRGYRSISHAPIGVCPSKRSARIPPPAPAKRWKVLKLSCAMSF